MGFSTIATHALYRLGIVLNQIGKVRKLGKTKHRDWKIALLHATN